MYGAGACPCLGESAGDSIPRACYTVTTTMYSYIALQVKLTNLVPQFLCFYVQ